MRDRQDHKDRAAEIIDIWLDTDPQRTSVLVECITDAIEEAWTAALRSLPLPAPTPVEEAERRFVEAAEAWMAVAHTADEPRAADASYAAWRALDAAHDALLAARQQERAEGRS